MRKGLKLSRMCPVALSLVLALAAIARADTIYLKNGRKLQGTNILKQNGKVTFETPAGTMSVPESSVDHIVAGDAPITPQWVSGTSAAEISLAPPASITTLPPPQSVIVKGVIDKQALAAIDARASTRDPDALGRAAVAESAVSHFELQRNNLSAALQHAQRALDFEPEKLSFLLDAAYVHLLRNEYQLALDLLEKARHIDPNSADIPKLTGWADYGLNRLSDAVAEWTRSQQEHPDPEIGHALEKAKRDLEVENAFREGRSAHFDLHYYGEAAPELARDVLRSLEASFEEIAASLNYTPTEPISVTLYTNQLFQDITRAPSWAGALNDGRIRVPVQGLTQVTPQLARVLKHELTHSFINEKTHGHCPTWLNEGTAQWMEGRRTDGTTAAALLRLYDGHNDPSLTVLEPVWMTFPSYLAEIAYAWSLAVVESIESASPGDLERILDRLGEGASGENAVNATMHLSYADLNAATADYLRKIH